MMLSDTNSLLYLLKGGCFCLFCKNFQNICITPSIQKEIENFYKKEKGKISGILDGISRDYDLEINIEFFQKEYQLLLKKYGISFIEEAVGHPTTGINHFKEMKKTQREKGDISIVSHILYKSTPISRVLTSDHGLIKIISVYTNSHYVVELVLNNPEGFSPKQIRYLFDESMGHYNIPIESFCEKWGLEYWVKFNDIKEKVDSIDFSGAVIFPEE